MLGRAFLESYGAKCEVLALSGRRRPVAGAAQCSTLDVRDGPALTREFRRFRPDWVIHAAAATNVDWCEAHAAEAASVNVDGTSAVATAGAAVGAALLYISTDTVYRGNPGLHDEKAPTDPLNVYARTKLEGEEAARRFAPRHLVARVNFVGWREEGGGLLGWGLKEMRAGRSIPGWTDVLFTPLAAPDLARVLLEMIEKDLSGLYCVGGSEALSKAEFLEEVAACWGLDRRLVVPKDAANGDGPRRPRNIRMDSRRLRRALGHALPGIRDGLLRLRQSEPGSRGSGRAGTGKGE
jgi:dTDP-4-dehydrorhamnose reductase